MSKIDDILVIIPARGGSKGLPGKNIKPLAGKPLINYSIDIAKKLFPLERICVSTDDEEIIDVVKKTGVEVPFIRPSFLATDTATTHDVLLHAIQYYENRIKFDKILLLQPTSPLRKIDHITYIIENYSSKIDMIASVSVSKANPYFNLLEENNEGYLKKIKNSDYQRRQDTPTLYQYNGSIYLINVNSLKKTPLHKFTKVKKYIMEDHYSIDIDTEMDFLFCEFIMQERKLF